MIGESGHLYITGRLSDMYISGGSSIHVMFWDELPRSGYGKVVRRSVREMLLGTAGQEMVVRCD